MKFKVHWQTEVEAEDAIDAAFAAESQHEIEAGLPFGGCIYSVIAPNGSECIVNLSRERRHLDRLNLSAADEKRVKGMM